MPKCSFNGCDNKAETTGSKRGAPFDFLYYTCLKCLSKYSSEGYYEVLGTRGYGLDSESEDEEN